MEVTNYRSSGAELSDILRCNENAFMERHSLCPDQKKAYAAITGCRTAKMGSHTLHCDSCDHKKICYNSCRNRHCPKCQYLKQVVWVDKLKGRLLPVRYFHIVFTVPEFMKGLFYLNQRECYGMLFSASAEAVKKAALNPAFLGAETGCLSVLHTWGQTLNYHPHIHMLVPAGGLDPDGMEWIRTKRKFFVPVSALSKIFRGIFMEKLRSALDLGKLNVPENDIPLYRDMKTLNNRSYENTWHVYIKKTFRGAGQVISYLGRYTHRVAISNSRILDADGGKVRFRWKDYRDGKSKTMEIGTAEFIRRFMRHILPTGFYKIRYFGIFSSANSRTKMHDCFLLLKKQVSFSIYEGLGTYEVLLHLLGNNLLFKCPCCTNGRMIYTPPVIADEAIP